MSCRFRAVVFDPSGDVTIVNYRSCRRPNLDGCSFLKVKLIELVCSGKKLSDVRSKIPLF